MSTNAGFAVSAHAFHFGVSQINMKDISEVDARKLMSFEHKALGYRPPPGSLAAEAQAAAAKHPDTPVKLPEEQIRELALKDARRIKEQRAAAGVDLSTIGEPEARKLMSEEHKALGHRPPSGSLAAKAQAAAAKHPEGLSGSPPMRELQRAALEDAANIEGGDDLASCIDLNFIGQVEARKLMSEEHKALGYRPPPESLAAQAQAAAAKHPHSSAGVDVATLTKAALEDAKKIETKRRASGGSSSSERPSKSSTTRSSSGAGTSADSTGSDVEVESEVNPTIAATAEARELQPEDQKASGYCSSEPLAAQAPSAVEERANEPVTEETVRSEEQKN